MNTQTVEHTAQTLRALILERVESNLPEKVMDALRPFHGKNITTRILDKMPGGKENWYLIRHYGWTSLGNNAYRRGDYKNGMEIMLARSEASVPLDIAWVEKENPAYYFARVERNHRRMEATNSINELEAVADAMNDCESARQALIDASARLKELTGFYTKFSPDEYAIEEACGMSDSEHRRFISDKYKRFTSDGKPY